MKTTTQKKYLTFSPYRSGLGNVIMSYELAFAIAAITNRTIIMPKTNALAHINAGAKESWHSPWDIFSKESAYENFNIIELEDFDEFKPHINNLGTTYSWTGNIKNIFTNDVYSWTADPNQPYHMTSLDICFVNDPGRFDSEDYRNFVGNRTIVDVNRLEKFLNFENNLFQHYWYLTYAGSAAERNQIKTRINRSFQYKRSYFDLATPVIQQLGQYNAVHVRRGDFFIQFGYSLKTIETSDRLKTQLNKYFNKDIPLYIATDEMDRSFFADLQQDYNIIFFEDIFSQKSKLDTAILEQIICSAADNFYGTFNSTFSKRINVMRGLGGRTAHDHMGINLLTDDVNALDLMPWRNRYDQRWSWNGSSYPQWTMENV